MLCLRIYRFGCVGIKKTLSVCVKKTDQTVVEVVPLNERLCDLPQLCRHFDPEFEALCVLSDRDIDVLRPAAVPIALLLDDELE
jgi:hypothetical protein